MLNLLNVEKSFKGKKVLDDVSFSVACGECVAVAAPNSAGKTTLISIVGGRLNPDKGKVDFSGKAATVPQRECLVENLTVKDTISLFYCAFSKDLSMMFSKASYETVMGLAPFADEKVGSLSGGRRRRLSVCLSLISDADLILLDEPFSGIDIKGRIEIVKTIEYLKTQNKMILMTCHEISEMCNCADRVLLLSGGKIARDIDLSQIDEKKLYGIMLESFKA